MFQEDAETAAFTREIRQALLREMERFLTEYRSAAGVQTQWKLPLIGFAGADHPYIRSLKQLISPTHYMPEEILPEEFLEVDELAETDTVPEVIDMSLSYDGAPVESETSNGSFIFTAASNTDAADYTATVMLSSDATLSATTPLEGQLYVDSVNGNTATLKFKLTVNDVDLSTEDEYALTLTNTSGTTWTGALPVPT